MGQPRVKQLTCHIDNLRSTGFVDNAMLNLEISFPSQLSPKCSGGSLDYGSIIFNLGASTSSVFCLIMFSDIATRAQRRAIHDDQLPAQVLHLHSVI